MKPAPFAYFAPPDLDAALAILAERSGAARVLAGGQSLIPLMNFRSVTPPALVDIGRIPGLDTIEHQDGAIRIGAMVRQRHAEFAPIIAKHLPLLRDAIGWIGTLPVRSRGTVCGSLAHADPAGELPVVMKVLGGEIIARSAAASRVIAAEEFFCGRHQTLLRDDEIIVAVRIPCMGSGTGYAFQEFTQRHAAPAIVAVAAVIEREGQACSRARIAAAGIGPVPVRLRAAEKLIEQAGLNDDAIERATEIARGEIAPASDLHASADFRRHITGVLLSRALRTAR